MKKNDNKSINAVFYAILAAAFYGISTPFSKILLDVLSPTFLSALLYLGAGIGMLATKMLTMNVKSKKEASLDKRDFPYIVAMVVLDILAPILLMIGLVRTSPSTVSLLNNFEIVATSIIALIIFNEQIGKKMWQAIALITLSSIILSIDTIGEISLSVGAIFVLLATISWGLENNYTRKLSIKNPLDIVIIKGLGSGLGALIIATYLQAIELNYTYIIAALFLGFIAYGLSIYMYIRAQRDLGAARTSSYYAIAPFIGVLTSWLLFDEAINLRFIFALAIMIIGVYFTIAENHEHEHVHKELVHEHAHKHDDLHHNHVHDYDVKGYHSHEHKHKKLVHSHPHTPDIHHKHSH
jgi:drug/metabolite transporter (DMT)-like permease